MLFLRVVSVCIGLSLVSGQAPRARHEIAKRWAYIENGDPQMRSIHTDCKEIVKGYSDGEMPFYEYTAKMQKCLNRQQRNNIPSYEDSPFFAPTFNVPAAEKRFETPKARPLNNQYYGYGNTNQYQSAYGSVDQRATISSPQYPQYQPAQTRAQVFPAPNYNTYETSSQQQAGMNVRSEIPTNQQFSEPRSAMYSSDIVKKDQIPVPDSPTALY